MRTQPKFVNLFDLEKLKEKNWSMKISSPKVFISIVQVRQVFVGGFRYLNEFRWIY